jgi:two-component system nitrogen regulation response regulator GlnG
MDREADLLDLSILYDAARGFLGLRRRSELLRYTLLSLMGASGSEFALFLQRTEEDRLVPQTVRGLSETPDDAVAVSRKLEKALADAPGPVTADGFPALGTVVARFAERQRIQALIGVVQEERLRGVFALGPKLFGEAHSERDLWIAGEIVKLAGLAVGPPAARRPGGARARGAKKLIEALRAEYPALAAYRGEGPTTAALFEELVALAEFDLPVLILGETGTGKEVVAQAIHDLSPHRKGSFEAINCAAIPRDLMASALFGHERGAFTGAVATARGAFERAGDGTIFLDEIGDMPPDTQASLLRVLQERSFRRVGGETSLPARARVVSATNVDLAQVVEEGRFRADLFYRLQMYAVRIPPLRERTEEVPILAQHLLDRHCGRRKPPILSGAFLEAVTAGGLPGNMRELESLIVGALVRGRKDGELRPEHLPERQMHPSSALGDVAGGGIFPSAKSRGRAGRTRLPTSPTAAPPLVPTPANLGDPLPPDDDAVPTYENMERQYILSVLELTEGNKKDAAELMRIPRTTLNARIKKLGIEAKG